jgi:hypothetical protein
MLRGRHHHPTQVGWGRRWGLSLVQKCPSCCPLATSTFLVWWRTTPSICHTHGGFCPSVDLFTTSLTNVENYVHGANGFSFSPLDSLFICDPLSFLDSLRCQRRCVRQYHVISSLLVLARAAIITIATHDNCGSPRCLCCCIRFPVSMVVTCHSFSSSSCH